MPEGLFWTNNKNFRVSALHKAYFFCYNNIMNENAPNQIEHIPTPEEIRSLFEQLVGEKEYEEVQKLEDEQGLYLWEIAITGEDGDRIEYAYMRKGLHNSKMSDPYISMSDPYTSIHVYFYNSEGVPTSGYTVAKLVNGTWKLIK